MIQREWPMTTSVPFGFGSKPGHTGLGGGNWAFNISDRRSRHSMPPTGILNRDSEAQRWGLVEKAQMTLIE